jgi:D-alanyl-lipoteichoic acid acyltransferase DltB (MBOAT superfamily)
VANQGRVEAGDPDVKFVDPFFLLVVLPAAVAAFYLVARVAASTLALGVIVLASLIFYAPYGSPALPLLIVSLGVNLALGVAVSRAEMRPGLRGGLLASGLVFNFGLLAVFKYFDQVQHMVAPAAAPLLAVGIPAGISFYTFHQAVFLRDAARRQPDVLAFFGAARSLTARLSLMVRYAAFVAFFPQLVIGPITFMSEFGPQIRKAGFGSLKRVNLQVGATLIIVGLFKKLCVADLLGLRIDPIFDSLAHGAAVSPAHALAAILGYFFQLYFDFSGYSDMALGIARLFGLRLPMNFDSPLRASGIVDFYRRWHMTLTRVIVLFVFTPLSLTGTRFAVRRKLKGWRMRLFSAWLPFLINFQIIALWHAAKYTFVVFGLVHGLWYVLENEVRASKRYKAYRARTSDRFRTITGMAVTSFPLMLTFALFRSDDLSVFGRLLACLVGRGGPVEGMARLGLSTWLPVAGAALIVYLTPNIYELLRSYRPSIRTFVNPSRTLPLARLAWRPTLAWGVFVAALLAIAMLQINQHAPFLYQAF